MPRVCVSCSIRFIGAVRGQTFPGMVLAKDAGTGKGSPYEDLGEQNSS